MIKAFGYGVIIIAVAGAIGAVLKGIYTPGVIGGMMIGMFCTTLVFSGVELIMAEKSDE